MALYAKSLARLFPFYVSLFRDRLIDTWLAQPGKGRSASTAEITCESIQKSKNLAVWQSGFCMNSKLPGNRKSKKKASRRSRHGALLFIFNLVCRVTRPVIELRFETCLAVWRGMCTPTGRRPRFRSSAVKSFLVEMLHFVNSLAAEMNGIFAVWSDA